jgi:hypothetical protein
LSAPTVLCKIKRIIHPRRTGSIRRAINDGAFALFSKSQAIRDELCTKEPENLAHRREFGIACFWVGIAFAKLQRWQESSEAIEKAIKATQTVIDVL